MEITKLIHKADGSLIPDDPYSVVGTQFFITDSDHEVIYEVTEEAATKHINDSKGDTVFGVCVQVSPRGNGQIGYEVTDNITFCKTVKDGRETST